MVLQALAAGALMVSIIVAAIAVSIGIARASARPAPAKPAAICADGFCTKPAY